MTRSQRIITLIEQDGIDVERDRSVIFKQIDGGLVRDKGAKEDSDLKDFTMGGNHSAYPNDIPEGEYWIDDQMSKEDKIATEVHEFVEDVMMRYYGLSYELTHSELANPCESIVRNYIRQHGKAEDGEEEKE